MGYRVPVLESFGFQPMVLYRQNDPPGSPAKGDRYIVDDTPTGEWVGHEQDIAWFDGSVWQYDTPDKGWICFVDEDNDFFFFNSVVWQNLQDIVGPGDMLKSVYDTDENGIADKAEELDDQTNVVTAAEARGHLDDAGKHREINDSGSGATELFSAEKISTEVGAKADKAASPTAGHMATLDAEGDPVDSGVVGADLLDIGNDTLDDVPEGTTYEKVKASELEAGQVKQVRAVTATADVSGDDIKTAVDRKASYDADLKVLMFTI